MPTWVHIVYHSVVSLVYLFLLTKLIGKRQLSQLTFFEYIIGITIGSIASSVAIDKEDFLDGTIAMGIYALLPILFELIALKSQRFRNFVEGKGRVLIKNGKVLERNLRKERMTIDDLMQQLRMKNAFKVADVEFALMEPNGRLSVLKISDRQPLTAKQLGLKVLPEAEPQVVVMDGHLVEQSLKTKGLDRHWLLGELEKQGVRLEDVFYAETDERGGLYIDLYEDEGVVQQMKTMQMTHVQLRKCQADLELFALDTNDERMKSVYAQEAKRLDELLRELTPYLNPQSGRSIRKAVEATT
ncbi:MAG TPA: DUF421 domain-containing protein [Bacilli bacterium]|nr:DUF421 domain-containing protein [Bacilli bacterium]